VDNIPEARDCQVFFFADRPFLLAKRAIGQTTLNTEHYVTGTELAQENTLLCTLGFVLWHVLPNKSVNLKEAGTKTHQSTKHEVQSTSFALGQYVNPKPYLKSGS
jgi:hypothetical protein